MRVSFFLMTALAMTLGAPIYMCDLANAEVSHDTFAASGLQGVWSPSCSAAAQAPQKDTKFFVFRYFTPSGGAFDTEYYYVDRGRNTSSFVRWDEIKKVENRIFRSGTAGPVKITDTVEFEGDRSRIVNKTSNGKETIVNGYNLAETRNFAVPPLQRCSDKNIIERAQQMQFLEDWTGTKEARPDLLSWSAEYKPYINHVPGDPELGSSGTLNGVSLLWYTHCRADRIQITGHNGSGDAGGIADPQFVQTFVAKAQPQAEAFCKQQILAGAVNNVKIVPTSIHIRVEQNAVGNAPLFEAYYNGTWQLTNYVHNFQQQQVAANQAAAAGRARAAQAKQTLQTSFVSQNGVNVYVSDSQLTANPFTYKGQVVGVRSRFTKMVSESDAVFTFNSPIFVGSVPSTRFRGSEDVVLAIKVVGIKEGVPYGTYVGVYQCTQGCSEFYD